MEITEIEQLIKKCNIDGMQLSEKGETFTVIARIVALRTPRVKFCKERWDFLINNGCGMEQAYDKLIRDSQENALAGLGILLLSLANKYKANMNGLRLEADTDNRTMESLMYSMIKIAMTHYKPYKKVTILFGMLCGYCISNEIDLFWFIKNRLCLEGFNNNNRI